MTLSRYLTVPETAEFFGLSVATVRRHIRAGRIKALKIGGSVRIPDTEIRRIESGPQV